MCKINAECTLTERESVRTACVQLGYTPTSRSCFYKAPVSIPPVVAELVVVYEVSLAMILSI